jgi:hypothetical protein
LKFGLGQLHALRKCRAIEYVCEPRELHRTLSTSHTKVPAGGAMHDERQGQIDEWRLGEILLRS